jgi:PBSX family phage terminase large subunit
MNLIKSNLEHSKIFTQHLAKPFVDMFWHPYFDDTSYYIITGGNSSGKSFSTAHYFLWRLMNMFNLNEIMLRKHLTHIYDSQYKLLMRHINFFGIEKHFDYTTGQKAFRIIYKPTKSGIVGKGLCAEHDIMSITGVTGAWFEEASQFQREYFHKFMTQIRQKGKPLKAVLTLNPVSKNNFVYTDFVGKKFKQLPLSSPKKWYDTLTDTTGAERKVAIAAVRTTYLDNLPNLDDFSIYNIEKYKTLLPEYYEVYGLGKFGSMADGQIFKREHYKEYSPNELPNDCAGFIYCDPNHAPKGKGDTTAIVNLYVSEREQKFYIKSARCFNCTDPNELINIILSMVDNRTEVIAFDGNRGQDAQWGHYVDMFAETRGMRGNMPDIKFCHYAVNTLSKNAQFHYNNGAVLFPTNFGKTDEGSVFLDQFHSFCGKKESNYKLKDDAPDAVICAIQLAFEHNYRFY